MPLLPIVSWPAALPPPGPKSAVLSGVKILYHRYVQNLVENTITFEGGVVVTYGPTVVTCESLTVNMTTELGDARGHVHVIDPIGTMDCDDLVFSRKTHNGKALNVHLIADSLRLDVGSATITPNRWILLHAKVRAYVGRSPILEALSSRVEVIPGKVLIMHKPQFGLFGLLTPAVFDTHSSLNSGSIGLNYPSITFKQGLGFGLSWQSELALGSSGLLDTSYRNYRFSRPSYQLEASTTLFRPSQNPVLGPPPNELGDRFYDSYFQNALVASEAIERGAIGTPRQTIAVNTSANTQPTGRDTTAFYDKPLEFIYEQSGQTHGYAWRGLMRFQSIRRDGGETEDRGILWVSGMGPTIRLGPGLNGYTRLDGQFFSKSDFSWARGEIGLTYRPVRFLRFATGGFLGGQHGTPDFAADELDATYGCIGRVDLLTGPTRVSYLAKLDPASGTIYDREFSVRQAIGILEAYVDFRHNPSQFRYGLELRLSSILDGISSHTPHRPLPDERD